jgi:hypothetical protein
MKTYERGHFKRLCKTHPFPGAWRTTSQFTQAESAVASEILERQRRGLEKGRPYTLHIGDEEFGRRSYLVRRVGD